MTQRMSRKKKMMLQEEGEEEKERGEAAEARRSCSWWVGGCSSVSNLKTAAALVVTERWMTVASRYCSCDAARRVRAHGVTASSVVHWHRSEILKSLLLVLLLLVVLLLLLVVLLLLLVVLLLVITSIAAKLQRIALSHPSSTPPARRLE
jgi:hypothetical protein